MFAWYVAMTTKRVDIKSIYINIIGHLFILILFIIKSTISNDLLPLFTLNSPLNLCLLLSCFCLQSRLTNQRLPLLVSSFVSFFLHLFLFPSLWTLVSANIFIILFVVNEEIDIADVSTLVKAFIRDILFETGEFILLLL